MGDFLWSPPECFGFLQCFNIAGGWMTGRASGLMADEMRWGEMWYINLHPKAGGQLILLHGTRKKNRKITKRNSSYFQTFYFCGPSPAWTEYVKVNKNKSTVSDSSSRTSCGVWMWAVECASIVEGRYARLPPTCFTRCVVGRGTVPDAGQSQRCGSGERSAGKHPTQE